MSGRPWWDDLDDLEARDRLKAAQAKREKLA